MTDAKLKKLIKLLSEFRHLIEKDNPLAAQVISLIYRWVDEELPWQLCKATSPLREAQDKIVELEAALAAKDEAANTLLKSWMPQYQDSRNVLDELIVLAKALSLTPPEALARREAEMRVIEAAKKWKIARDWMMSHNDDHWTGTNASVEADEKLDEVLASLDQAKETPGE